MFHQPRPACAQPNPFHPLCKLSYRQIDPFVPQRGALRFSVTAWQTKAWGDARGQPPALSPIHNFACLCHCRLPPWKSVVLGCAGELLAAMVPAYVMTLSVSQWQKKINIVASAATCVTNMPLYHPFFSLFFFFMSGESWSWRWKIIVLPYRRKLDSTIRGRNPLF